MKGNPDKNIFVFGDSIVQGFFDSRGGWAIRLKQYFDNAMTLADNFPNHGFYNMVFPLGIQGDTTGSLLIRLESESKARSNWKNVENIFIFAIGANDAAMLSVNESKINLEEIVKKTKKTSERIVFLEVIPVDESLTCPVAWDYTHIYNEKIIAFNKTLNEVAISSGACVIPIFDDLYRMDYKSMLADGVHPNDDGHKYIFEKVKDFLIANFF